MKSKRQKLSPEAKAKIVAMARAITLAPSDVLTVVLLSAMDRALFAKSEAGEAITEDEQVQVAEATLKKVKRALEVGAQIAAKKEEANKRAEEIATDTIQQAIKSAKAEKAAQQEFKLPPGGIVAPGSDSVN